ncbi:Cation/H+ exchanger [Catenaria anguillulae PL171]|uniref:Cation/H+ exchanger n=1 Tax=Catenaria anguillulae PL171 TaxID=765915 RepID=A0A1Y2H8I6_9FUNG|nr:Cation/H+ exchanger [Catenaria anguillulae PL171]
MFATATYLTFFLLSHLLKRHLWINQVLWCTAIGVCLGPYAFAWVQPRTDGMFHVIHLQEAARYAIAIQVVASAMALPRGWFRRHWKEVAWLVGPIMLVTSAFVWGVAVGLFSHTGGVHWPEILALAAALAPPDPVVVGTLVRGKFAQAHVAEPLRNLLNAESSVGSGIAYVYFRLALMLSIHHDESVGRAFAIWGWRCVAAEALGAVVAGLVLGYLLATVSNVSRKWDWMDQDDEMMVMMPAMALTLNAVDGYGGDGAMAVFVMGTMVNEWGGDTTTVAEHHEHTTDTMDSLGLALFFVYFGATSVQWSVLPRYGIAKLVGFSLLVTLARRLIIIPLVAHWLLPSQRYSDQQGTERWFLNAVMLAVYAPVGAATVFMSAMFYLETGQREVLDISTFVVLVSIVLFGVLSVPVAKAKQRWEKKVAGVEQAIRSDSLTGSRSV